MGDEMKNHVWSVFPAFSVLCVVMLATVPSATHAQCTPTEKEKLLAADGAADDYFGYSVGVSGIHAVIGAHQDDDSGPSSGSAYVFRYNGSHWIEDAKLVASDGAENDEFGAAVAISGDTAVIGAWLDDDLGNWSGSAYVFEFDGSIWTQEAKLIPSDGGYGDWFGASDDDDNGLGSGSVYVYDINCPGVLPELIFMDGFDLGNTLHWSVTAN